MKIESDDCILKCKDQKINWAGLDGHYSLRVLDEVRAIQSLRQIYQKV